MQTGTAVLEAPADTLQHDGMANVILYNDDVNTLGHIVKSLCDVFGHSEKDSVKIAMDAHTNGKTIAQTEGRLDAITHKGQLVSLGITAEVERI